MEVTFKGSYGEGVEITEIKGMMVGSESMGVSFSERENGMCKGPKT